MHDWARCYLLIWVLLLLLGCGGGSGEGSKSPAPPPDPPADPVLEAPCNLAYPDSELVIQSGGRVSGFFPTVECGTPDAYAITPALPDGLSIAPDTGVISGSPVEEIYSGSHTIEASNAFGPALFELTIHVRPLFEFTAEGSSGTYSGLDGSGSLSVTAQLTEDLLNPGFPDPVVGVNFCLAHTSSLLNPVSFSLSPELEAMNSGTGPMFMDALMYPGEVIFYSIFSILPSDLPVFAVPTALVEISYETHPDQFVGSTGDVSVNFEWLENSTETLTPDDLFIILENAVGFPAASVDFTATLQRID